MFLVGLLSACLFCLVFYFSIYFIAQKFVLVFCLFVGGFAPNLSCAVGLKSREKFSHDVFDSMILLPHIPALIMTSQTQVIVILIQTAEHKKVAHMVTFLRLSPPPPPIKKKNPAEKSLEHLLCLYFFIFLSYE